MNLSWSEADHRLEANSEVEAVDATETRERAAVLTVVMKMELRRPVVGRLFLYVYSKYCSSLDDVILYSLVFVLY